MPFAIETYYYCLLKVVDHLHKNVGSKELEERINELKIRNDDMEQNANELFAERKEEETEVEGIEKMIECQKATNEAIQNNMVIGLSAFFFALVENDMH